MSKKHNLAKGEIDFKMMTKMVRAEGKSLLQELSAELVSAGALCPEGVEKLFPDDFERPDMDYVAVITLGKFNKEKPDEKQAGLGAIFRLCIPGPEDGQWLLWNYVFYSHLENTPPIYWYNPEISLVDPWTSTYDKRKVEAALSNRKLLKAEMLEAIKILLSEVSEEKRLVSLNSDIFKKEEKEG